MRTGEEEANTIIADVDVIAIHETDFIGPSKSTYAAGCSVNRPVKPQPHPQLLKRERERGAALMTPTLRTASEYLEECRKLVNRESFGREAEARFNATMRLFDIANHRNGPVQMDGLSRKALAEHLQRTIDPATLAFFCGHLPEEREVSVSSGVIERSGPTLRGGRPTGAVTFLKNYSSALSPENRTYAGLTTATGGADGGNIVPTGFIPTVLAAMKRSDCSKQPIGTSRRLSTAAPLTNPR